jgi:hypothetical protein
MWRKEIEQYQTDNKKYVGLVLRRLNFSILFEIVRILINLSGAADH